jgi:phosphate transport system substrate-binding protein
MAKRTLLTIVTLALGACSGGHHDTGAPAPSTPGATAPAPAQQTLTLKGSDTMVILSQRFAEKYMQEHPGTTIQVSGGGSGTGIAALLNGTTDIADASRPLKDSERTQIRARGHGDAVETKIAVDALAVYVNEHNPVTHLSIEQLQRVFLGQVHNWREIGGADAPIVLYSRENNSGTYAYFKEHVLQDLDFAATAQTLPGTAAVINAVSSDPNGIGYGGIAYAHGVHNLQLAARGSTELVEPTMHNALSGRYPLSRFLYMYTAGAPQGLTKAFLDWAVSPDGGQRLVEAVGYYPLPTSATATATAQAQPQPQAANPAPATP